MSFLAINEAGMDHGRLECESYIQRETDLKCTIEELEKELEDTKKKSFELSSRLESQKKLKLLKQLGRKA
ncbi:hypothetical protein RND71_011887 [Anisodus tanguticus]|uniref:Uncharacterized protein n=1 Tax=Anisodus tanguticus TaxID=243964 RepID=A0AAE1VQ84_9SOLA|nr:hypothetical protein RND71_011887 [Anisodus tanguticus]